MSQHHRASKALDQFAAKVAKQARRNLAGSPSAATLAARLAIEQINHKTARALIRGMEKSIAQYRALAGEALGLLKSDDANAASAAWRRTTVDLACRFAEATAVQDVLINEAMQARRKNENAARARSAAARKAADALHGRAGGSRDKAEQMRQRWASGKYSSRDTCAEQEFAGLEMSFSAARKALRNTPEPKHNT